MPDLNSLPPSTRSPTSPSHPPPPAPSSSASLPPSSSSVAMSLSSPTNNSEAASSQSNRHRQPSSPSPSLSPSRTAATSLQAAATVNAGLHHGSRRAWISTSCSTKCVISTDSHLRLFRLPFSTSCNFLKRCSPPISSPNEPTTKRSCNSRAWRDAP